MTIQGLINKIFRANQTQNNTVSWSGSNGLKSIQEDIVSTLRERTFFTVPTTAALANQGFNNAILCYVQDHAFFRWQASGTPNGTTIFPANDGGVWVQETIGDTDGTVTSIGITAPAAFTVTNSPVTTSGVIDIAANGTASEYIKGDGTLGTLPGGTVTNVTASSPLVSSGGTAPNISTSMNTNKLIGRSTAGVGDMEEITVGAGLSLSSGTLSTTGGGTVTNVSALTIDSTGTDLSSTVANPTTTPVITLSVPTASALNRGVLSSADWTTFNSKQNALTLTTTGSSGSATFISNTLNVPTYTLSGLGGVPTSRQLTINGTAYDLSADRTWSVGTVTSVAALTLGTTGTDVSSTVATGTSTPVITLNIPTASASNRGALSSIDWTTFNSKQNAITLTTTGTSGAATLVGATLNIPQYQSVITNPVTGTGTTNYHAKWTSSSTLNNSLIYDDGTNVGIGTSTPFWKLQVSLPNNSGGSNVGVFINDINLAYSGSSSWVAWGKFADPAFNGLTSGIRVLYLGNNGYEQGMAFHTASAGVGALSSPSSSEVFRITNTRNMIVGGTTDAGYKLDVNGTARVQSSITWGNTGGGRLTFSGSDAYMDAALSGGSLIIRTNGSTTAMQIFSTQNVGIGTTTDVASSILTLQSTTKGFLQPRMTTTQRNAIATPATGLAIYNTTTNTEDYYNGTTWVSLQTSAAAVKSFGAWQTDATQTAAVNNTGYGVRFDTADISGQGITVQADSLGNNTLIKMANAGYYNIQFSFQFQNSDNQLHDVSIWLRKNGQNTAADVAGSGGFVSIPNSHGGTPGHCIAAWNYFVQANVADYFQLVWSTTSAANVTMEFYPAGSPPPSAASAILTVNQVN
jgi:hypothetical protein